MVLKDVTLCAIVRDEKMNAAGGIRDFVASTSPHVERAVIVDTGSRDGTREELEQLQSEFRNLQVLDRKFRGFADARNYSIAQARTKYVLALDADERIRAQDFPRVTDRLAEGRAVSFEVLNVYPHGNTEVYSGTYNVRVFPATTRFQRAVFEIPCQDGARLQEETWSKINIYHFLPCADAAKIKRDELYSKLIGYYSSNPDPVRHFGDSKALLFFLKGAALAYEICNGYRRPSRMAPSKMPSFAKLRQYNPHREKYR